MADSPRARRKSTSRRDRRRSTNFIGCLSQAMIQVFREAFNIIDQDGDGHISRQDLIKICTSLGSNITEQQLCEMMSHVPGQLNFTTFLTMFADKMTEMDSFDVVKHAAEILDNEGKGFINAEELAVLLQTVGYDRMTYDEVATLMRRVPTTRDGKISVDALARMITFTDEH